MGVRPRETATKQKLLQLCFVIPTKYVLYACFACYPRFNWCQGIASTRQWYWNLVDVVRMIQYLIEWILRRVPGSDMLAATCHVFLQIHKSEILEWMNACAKLTYLKYCHVWDLTRKIPWAVYIISTSAFTYCSLLQPESGCASIVLIATPIAASLAKK